MKLTCPRCRAKILPTSVNVSTDLAKCDNCQEILKASRLMDQAEALDHPEPPAGSRLLIRGESEFEAAIDIPGPRLSLTMHVFVLVFAAFWLTFCAFWTWGASKGSWTFACFSIPFWIIGISMVVGVVNSILEKQFLEIRSDRIRFQKIRPLFGKSVDIPVGEIDRITIDYAKPTPGHQNELVPTIWHGMNKTAFGHNLCDAEMEWLVRYVRMAVSRSSGRTIPG